MMRINVFNAYSKYRISVAETKSIVRHVLKNEGVINSNINIVYINDKKMIKLNSKYLCRKRTTDVISFTLEDESTEKLEGEVYVNLEQACKQADEYNVTFSNEVFRLVIHGVLHLLGYKDNSVTNKKCMTKLENHYLEFIN